MTDNIKQRIDALFGKDPEIGAIDGLEQVLRRYGEVLEIHNPRHAATLQSYSREMIAELRFTVAQNRESGR